MKKRIIMDVLLIVGPILALMLFIRVFFLIGVVPSESMQPLMNTDSGIIANRLAYLGSEPNRGDVIVFKKGKSFLTKRIIGIPGDVIDIQNGIIYINKQAIVEEYLFKESSTEPLNGTNQYIVPDGSYFVLGDNREHSNDSRAWDEPYVPFGDIEAKVICVFSINPFSHGIYYRDVQSIEIEETYSGVPQYDEEKVILEKNDKEIKEEKSDAISTTLPAETIAPESIFETESVSVEESADESTVPLAAEDEELDRNKLESTGGSLSAEESLENLIEEN